MSGGSGKSRVRFGPAGIPIRCKGTGMLEGIRCCAELGLAAMEMEFVQGVRLAAPMAGEIAAAAPGLGISLSSHAPYFVNLCSREKQKIANSKRNILQAAEATFMAGGRITVFHPGYYQGQEKEEAYQAARKVLIEINDSMEEKKIRCVLGAETVGKKSQFGGFDEAVRLAKDLHFLQPVLDFSHLHARGDFTIRGEGDYAGIFSMLEQELGEYVRHFHAHFSEINYTDKGERNHLPLGTNNQPPYRPLMKLLAENGYSGTIICESPKLEFDALRMQEEFYSAAGK